MPPSALKILEISPTAYAEIAHLLRAAGFDHRFGAGAGLIDMTGIALGPEQAGQSVPEGFGIAAVEPDLGTPNLGSGSPGSGSPGLASGPKAE